MRSRPLPELFLLCAVFASAGFALFRLTAPPVGLPKPSATAPVLSASPQVLPAHAIIEAAHPFFRMTIRASSDGSATLLSYEGEATTQFSGELNLPLTEGAPDMLLVEVEWPPETPRTALELAVEPDGHPATRVTIWGEQTASAILEVKL